MLFVADWVQRQLSWSDPTGQYLNQFYSLPGGEGAGQCLNQIHKSKDDRMLISAPRSGFCLNLVSHSIAITLCCKFLAQMYAKHLGERLNTIFQQHVLDFIETR